MSAHPELVEGCGLRDLCGYVIPLGHQHRSNLHSLHRLAVFADDSRDGARVDGGSARRSHGASARPRLAESARARGPDRHHPVSPRGHDDRLSIPHRLGETGAGQRPPAPASTRRLRARRGRRTGQQSASRRRRGDPPADRAGVGVHAGRTERHGADGDAVRDRDADQRAARRLQHDSDSAARRRKRPRWTAAAAARVSLRLADSAVRVRAPLRAHVHPRFRLPRHPAVASAAFLASVTRARVVSGMRPTGRLHLGHLVGALGNWVPLQDQYDCFYFVADWHALTSDFADTSQLTSYTYENVADWIGAGLDPERSTFFVQSLVPEHAELYLLLSMVVPVPWLERVPTYKEQQETLKDKDLSSIGFLGYPLLQTADVAMYDAQLVPVGEGQVAHLELAREAVRRFNNFFGDTLVEPKPLLTTFGRLPGLDGDKKMSKSLGNTIHLSDSADEVRKKVMRMYTDPKRVRADIPGTVEGNPVFVYHDAFNANTAEVDDLKARYRAGKVGDVEVKTKLADALNARLDPIRARRAAILAQPDRLKDILFEGSRRARTIA